MPGLGQGLCRRLPLLRRPFGLPISQVQKSIKTAKTLSLSRFTREDEALITLPFALMDCANQIEMVRKAHLALLGARCDALDNGSVNVNSYSKYPSRANRWPEDKLPTPTLSSGSILAQMKSAFS